MSRWFRSLTPLGLGLALIALAGWVVTSWTVRNGLMDGYQNEFLHVGNALDLWEAWGGRDGHTLSYLLRENYWPPVFYVSPWPLFALFGAGHLTMIWTNLLHLAVLLAAVFHLGVALRDRTTGLLAMPLVLLLPSIFGNLVRFEPNVAVCAWVTLGALCLVRSRGFSDRRWSVAFGAACAVGLLMDRISLALFLGLPAGVEVVRALARPDRAGRVRNLVLATLALAVLCGWWHVEFVQHHLAEITSQGGVGEIDSTGSQTEARNPWSLNSLLYYPAILLDEQAGLVPGIWLLLALLGSVFGVLDRRRVPFLVVASGLLVFTIVQKKQVYYTIPLLGCLAVLGAERLRVRPRLGALVYAVVLFCGIHQIGRQMWGEGLPLPTRLSAAMGDPSLPAGWADRRFTQARPPNRLALPIDALVDSLPPGDLVVFSDDHAWFETYLVLQLRERRPGDQVRGLISNPIGTYEWFRTADAFVVVSGVPGEVYPSARTMNRTLEQRDYDLGQLPPVVDVIEAGAASLDLSASWKLGHGPTLRVFVPTQPGG
jgi:hypothetical protein